MSIELVMPLRHLILRCPLFLWVTGSLMWVVHPGSGSAYDHNGPQRGARYTKGSIPLEESASRATYWEMAEPATDET